MAEKHKIEDNNFDVYDMQKKAKNISAKNTKNDFSNLNTVNKHTKISTKYTEPIFKILTKYNILHM